MQRFLTKAKNCYCFWHFYLSNFVYLSCLCGVNRITAEQRKKLTCFTSVIKNTCENKVFVPVQNSNLSTYLQNYFLKIDISFFYSISVMYVFNYKINSF